MSSEWNEYYLKDLVKFKSGGTPSKKKKEYWGGTIPWISASSMYEYFVDDSDEKLTSCAIEDGAKMVDKGTVLLLVRGSILHQRVPICMTLKSVSFNQDVKALIPKNGIDAEYIFYWLRGKEKYLLQLVDNTGIGAGKFNTDQLEKLIVKLPPYLIKERIINVAKSLDQKIHLNRQTNETLETMTQAIFKSWFVDFDPVRAKIEAKSVGHEPNRAAMAAIAGISIEQDWDEIEAALDQKLARMSEDQQQQFTHTAQLFPDELVENEIGLVPKGWGIKPFYDTIEIIGGGTPKTKVDEYWGGDILWYSVVDAPNESDVFVIDTEKKITETGLENSSAKLVDAGTTIISARGTVGKLALTPKPMTYNQSCYGLRSKIECPFFNYYKTKQLVENLKRGSHGSIFDTITQKTFKTIDIAQPSENLETKFDEVVGSIMSKIQKNSEQNITLSQLRDTLLPKLISGELRLMNNNKIHSI
jgi:type I restriction enzyme, S subunit